MHHSINHELLPLPTDLSSQLVNLRFLQLLSIPLSETVNWAMELASTLTRLEGLSIGVETLFDEDEDPVVAHSWNFLVSLDAIRHFRIISFPFRAVEEADSLIKALSHLRLQSLSIMHPVMAADQPGLELRLMRSLRKSPVVQGLRRLHLGLGLAALRGLVSRPAVCPPTQAITELWIELSQAEPMRSPSHMGFLRAFSGVKFLSLSISPFKRAGAGLPDIERWRNLDLAGAAYGTDILSEITKYLPHVEGLSLAVSYHANEWVRISLECSNITARGSC